MPTTKTYKVVGGRAKVQIEDLLGKNPGGGWKYQAPGQGNDGAEGAHYYFKSQKAQGSLKSAPDFGRFTIKLNVEDAGKYQILLRGARDTNKPGDARNDIWIKVDGNTQKAMPKGTPSLTSGGDGFVKFKGAQTHWINAHQFSTHKHGDKNPESVVVFDKGVHTITFAPRSTGYHIDSVMVVKKGSKGSGPDTKPEPGPDAKAAALVTDTMPEPLPESKPDPKPDAKPEPAVDNDTVKVAVASGNDDWETAKASASDDLELGEDEQSVGLRFEGVKLEQDAEIKSAYFVFTAAEDSTGAANLTIQVEDSDNAESYSKGDAPDDRAYAAEEVEWNVEAWKKGQTYKSADIAELIEKAIEDGDLDTLAFRISGSGERAAQASESGEAPQLVIEHA